MGAFSFNGGQSIFGGDSGGGSLSRSFQASESKAGQKYLPWAEPMVKRAAQGVWDRFLGTGQPGAVPSFDVANAQAGGERTTFPEITVGGIWSPQQTQEQVNLMRSTNDAATAGRVKDAGERAAGSGFRTSSPLYQELVGNLQGQNLAVNTAGENELRTTMAEKNSKQNLASQLGAVERAQAVSEDDIRRRQMALALRGQDVESQASRENALLQALFQGLQPLSSSESKSKGGSFSISGGKYG